MLALDVLLLLMIIVCIVYCWILNQRIRDLHNSRVEFARMIKEFDAAVVKAERCISDLSTLSSNATLQIKNASSEAEELIDELKTLNDLGNTLGAKLEHSISDARKALEAIENTAMPKTKRKKALKETKAQSHLPLEDVYIQDTQDKTDTIFSTDENKLSPEHTSLLRTMLSKITTHKHQGTMDQSSYYGSLKKVSAGK
jgi:chromosome segregation ATPase